MPGINGHNPQAYLGSWKNWEAVSGNISGTWRTSSDVYVNHNGTWKQVWVRLTAPTNGSTSLNDVTATVSWTPGVGQEGFRIYRNGSLIGTAASNATTFTDTLPALQTTYTYTVSAYAGSTETAQISAGTARQEVPAPTSSNASISRDWTYSNNDWDGINISFSISASGSFTNVSGFQYSVDNGTNWLSPSTPFLASQTISLAQDSEVNVRWRAARLYNGVTYYSSISPNRNIKAGRPLRRNASQNFDYAKTVRFDQTIGETVNFTGGFGTVIDSYQFRNVDAVGSSLLANSNRRVIFRRPAGAGGDISIPFGSSSTSGTGDDNGNYVQGPFTNYVDGFYGLTTIGSWSVSSTPYVTYTLRFTGRSISQAPVAYSIT